MNTKWHFWIGGYLFNGHVSIGKFKPTLETVIHSARIKGRNNALGEVDLIQQIKTYREMAGGSNTCSLVEARDYIWHLNGRDPVVYP